MTHPDPNEQRLREALGTMNELQPPTDELFVERAIRRGRSRVARRRGRIVGVAAALAIIAGGAGTWWAANAPRLSGTGSTTAGAAPEVATKDAAQGDSRSASGAGSPGALAAQGGPGWFVGPMTPQRAAVESLAAALTSTWASTFSGAWATDESNTSVVVAVTRPDAALEQLVRTTMPAPDDVRFVVAAHSYRDKAALADSIIGSAQTWRREGVVIHSVAQDFRADRVVVVASGGDAARLLTARYGSQWVTVTALPEASVGVTR